MADGPSASHLRRSALPDNIFVIAVNGVIEWIPRADAFFSLDPDDRVRGLMEKRRPGVSYFCAVPDDYGRADADCPAHRVAPLEFVNYLRRITGPHKLGAKPGLSDDPGAIHTGNSAYGGLGLAKLLGGRRVALFGVDGTADRLSGGRARGLTHLPWLFSTVREPDIEILNGSPRSSVTCFPRVPPEVAVSWLLEEV